MMRPIMLKGHERSLTQVKFNREGDLLLSVAKDRVASVWYSSNGERLGTFIGHIGTIWSIDIDPESELVVTGSADFSAKLWNARTGECVHTWSLPSPVRRVEFNATGEKFLMVTDQVMKQLGSIEVYPVNRSGPQAEEPMLTITTREGFAKATVAGWSYGGLYIIAGHADGTISKYDAKTGEFLASTKPHTETVSDLQFSPDGTYFITSSRDKTAHILDVDGLQMLKTYETDAPMNSAAITPVKDFVILGGGQDAKDVTTTSSKQGKFEARFFHKVFQDEIGRVNGHFGPLNYIAVHPQGTSYASGGEDGYVRLHHFEKSYFDFLYDVERTAQATASTQTEVN
ncbi:unnamed protein product [Kuraishia capsulata CBS 1993]|uniref:Eukaryotic translation initiation factor 3 subunit I n=1 Tax=Kuraishia capsulata CBS 1993 TaxID=1382522 RepID=W6MJZ8_9ASCO|nr:uncharacterized protein KUCA_T00000854001 [Kuraishia capsulata CBS 1993]CDK24887.1 unnamed protein product [Kuraishia capsulata CBS 1993]